MKKSSEWQQCLQLRQQGTLLHLIFIWCLPNAIHKKQYPHCVNTYRSYASLNTKLVCPVQIDLYCALSSECCWHAWVKCKWSKLVQRILPFKSLTELCNFSLSIINELLSIQVENNKNISTWGWKSERVCWAHSMVKGAKMTKHKRNTHVILMHDIITASITSKLPTYIVPNVQTRSNRNCYKAYQRY